MSDAPTVLTGWGRTAPSAAHLRRARPEDLPGLLAGVGERGLLARGLGRSYGDTAQNAGGVVLEPLPSWWRLDSVAGTVRASAGTSLHDLIRALVPQGWFPPVTPGTRYVTLGGAVACDVHGKNHHRHGSIGQHVRSLVLVTADGTSRRLAPDREPELFWATVGGLGLTGVVTEVELDLVPVESGWMRVTTERAPDLAAVMARLVAADDVTYSVAWIDLLAAGRRLGRSVVSLGEHARLEDLDPRRRDDRWPVPGVARLDVPLVPPRSLVGPRGVRAFNEAWYRRAPQHRADEIQSAAAFFHPLDGVGHWNRLYGRRGMVQYQLVVPDRGADALPGMVERIVRAGWPSFLAVLKRFGPGNPGLLSFPTQGWTLALDLPADPRVATLFDELDERVLAAGGRVYLAKDARVAPRTVRAMYPQWDRFRAVRREVDPRGVFQSDLGRRLGL
jgi:decaprenylphospho-beta-D-ribofuranose 2-oxidase